jgi:hypothetical protein
MNGGESGELLSYFGSVDSRLMANDFTPEQCRDLTVRKENCGSRRRRPKEVNAKR